MENISVLQHKLSSEQIKQKIRSQTAEFAKQYHVKVDVLFAWLPTSSVGTIKQTAEDKFTIRVNLSVFLINLRLKSKFTPLIMQNYFMVYIVAYMTLIAELSKRCPKSYAEGLAALDVLIRFDDSGFVSMNLPIMTELILSNRRNLFPADVYCSSAAIELLEKIYASSENTVIHNLFAELPEIMYNGSKLPLYSSLYIAKKVAVFGKNKKKPAAYSCYYIDFINNTASMTLSEMLEHGAKTNDPLYVGLAMRLIMLFGDEETERVLKKENLQKIFSESADEFKNNAVRYIKLYNDYNNSYFIDNAIAIQKTVNRMNEISSRYHLNSTTGSVYSFFC